MPAIKLTSFQVCHTAMQSCVKTAAFGISYFRWTWRQQQVLPTSVHMYQFARPLVPAEGVSGKYQISSLRLPFCRIPVHVSTLLRTFRVPCLVNMRAVPRRYSSYWRSSESLSICISSVLCSLAFSNVKLQEGQVLVMSQVCTVNLGRHTVSTKWQLHKCFLWKDSARTTMRCACNVRSGLKHLLAHVWAVLT